METITLEPLRWLEQPARVRIVENNGHQRAYFQVTSPRDVGEMAKGRPAEELPRVLGILSPSHHLVSAMALDRLFKVEPPPLAVNMRQAFLQTQFFRHHARKLFFLLASVASPFPDYSLRQTPTMGPTVPNQFLDEVMRCVALAQEAAAILGGRADHPMSAIPGGVGRFLKEPHYPRLSEIAEQCVKFASRLAAMVRETVFRGSALMDDFKELRLHPMRSLTMANGSGNAVLRDPEGKEAEQIAPEAVFETIGLHEEAWSYEPFAFLKKPGWETSDAENSGSLYFVGPLARLNRGEELPSSLAEQERQLLIETLGPFPHFSVAAAYWSLVVEVLQAAENMVELCNQDKLTGPAIRNLPSERADSGYASLESPEGFISHRYRTDDRAMIEEIEILDAAAENNALRCFLVRKAVEASFERNLGPEETKRRIEISLLPF